MRTGAVSAMATRYLAIKDSKTAGIVGLGVQGKGQLLGLLEVCDIEKMYCYDVVAASRKKFIEEMSRQLA